MKKLIALLLIGCLLTMISGCSSQPSSTDLSASEPLQSASNEGDSGKEHIDLTMSMSIGGDVYHKYFDTVLDIVMEENPYLSIEFIPGSSADYYTKLAANMAAGTAPDLVKCLPDTVGLYAESGYLVNLEDYIDPEILENHPLAALLEEYKESWGGLYAIPYDLINYMWIYNPVLFEEAGIAVPKTLDDWLEAARTMKEKTGAYLMGHVTITGDSNLPLTFAKTSMLYGAHTVNNAGEATFNSPEMVKLLTVFQTMYNEGLMAPDCDYNQRLQLFANGKIAMLGETFANYTNMAELNPNWTPDMYATAGFDMVDYVGCGSAYDMVGISGYCEHPEEAVKVIEQMLKFYDLYPLVMIGEVDLLTEMADAGVDEVEAILKEKAPFTVPFFSDEINELLVPYQPPTVSATHFNELAALMTVAYEEIMFNGSDVQTTLDAAQIEAEAILASE